jgi:transposase-like protein
MSNKLTVRDFFKRFPTEEACLDHVMTVRYGMRHTCRKCGVVDATFHRLANRRAYSCAHCGDHVYPCANTVLQDTRTPLQLWFYALYLFVTTRHGVSGKELQRQLGVTYKTAWRIGQQLRQLMCAADEFRLLKGHVEADEAYIGGRLRRVKGRGKHLDNKTTVVGLKEREGLMQATVVKNAKLYTLRTVILENVERGSIVSTDEHSGYNLLTEEGYRHGAVKHSAKQWAKRDEDGVNHHTNSVESFWRLFKNSIKSTHIHVSEKYMQRYLDEFTFRSNNRQMGNAMFDLLIASF